MSATEDAQQPRTNGVAWSTGRRVGPGHEPDAIGAVGGFASGHDANGPDLARITFQSFRDRPVARIRPLCEDDIPRIAALRATVFSWRRKDSAEARGAALRTIFFGNPFCDEALPSLVYENDAGNLVGFLGVSARPLRWRGTELRAAVCTGFMVDRDWRGMVGIQLLRKALDGPQDLTIADSPNPQSRVLVEQLGAVTAVRDSLFWVRPLRPVRYAVGQIRNGWPLLCARLLARPLATGLDAMAVRMSQSPFHLKAPDSHAEPLTPGDLLRCLAEVGSTCSPSPHYEERALTWLLGSLRHGPRGERLQTVLVRSRAGDVIGWYIRFAARGGVSEVVQMGARRERYGDLLHHLFYSAWRDGSLAVSGRVQAPFLETLAEHGCVLCRDGPPVLIHSRRAEVLDAIQGGRAFLSRLEGEWWMIHLSFA